MIDDISGESQMEPIVGMLFSTVKLNYHRLKSIIIGMSQAEIDFKGFDNHSNSTAQLLKHLAYVDLQWVYRFKEQSVPEKLEKKYGPMLDDNNHIPTVKKIPLEVLLYDYDFVFNMLKEVCLELKDTDLDKIVSYELEKKATFRWGIWHLADHNRYHQAHINQLRKWYAEMKKSDC